MNNNHLQETARHYAQLAEQARVDLQEANEINGELLGLIEALCEHFDLNMEELLEMAQTRTRAAQLAAMRADAERRADVYRPVHVGTDQPKPYVSPTEEGRRREQEHGELIGIDNMEKKVPLLFGKDGKVIRHLTPPPSSKPVEGAKSAKPRKGKGKGKGKGKNLRFDMIHAITNEADRDAYMAKAKK